MWRFFLLLVLAVAGAVPKIEKPYPCEKIKYSSIEHMPQDVKEWTEKKIKDYNEVVEILNSNKGLKPYEEDIFNKVKDYIFALPGNLEGRNSNKKWIENLERKLQVEYRNRSFKEKRNEEIAQEREEYPHMRSELLYYTVDDDKIKRLEEFIYLCKLYPDFGCVFYSKDNYLVYSKETNTSEFRKWASNFDVKYGIEVDAKDFSGIDKLKTMIDEIQPIYTNVTERLIVGSIPEFIEFYKSRKRCDSDFETFFKNYYPNTNIEDNKTTSHAYLLVLRLFKQIIDNMSEVKKHCYLVAVYENSPSELLEKQEFRLSHMAAAIRINVEGRPGVILMDTGDNAFGPVVLMKDLKFPHMYSKLPTVQSSQDTSNEKKSTCFTSAKKVGQKFIRTLLGPKSVSNTTINHAGKTFSLNFTTNNKIVQNIDGQPNPNVYNISGSYCSFVTSTFKRQLLLKTSKTLFRRDSEGYVTASVSFDITENNPQFKMTMYEKGRSKNEMIIGFDEFHRMNETQTNHLNAVLRKLELESSDSQVTLRNILEDAVKIAKDKEFMNEYKENHLYMVKVREGQIENTKKF